MEVPGGPQGARLRAGLKEALARTASRRPASGLSVLIYHRVGGGTPDERDLDVAAFQAQLDLLASHRIVGLDTALDELAAGDDSPKAVLTFDDGFAEVHDVAWPLLAERRVPFTLYLATAYVGGQMHWDGSTAKAPGPGLSWEQLAELAASGLCTLGNHTHTHARPEALTIEELDRCSEAIRTHLGVVPRHFAYTWGVQVSAMEPRLRARFRSAATGRLGRNHPGEDPLRLKRIPVRASDPIEFFAAKLTGRLLPERAYAGIVAGAKRLGVRA
ncbi:MAG: polysaccharide deacetylase family protein [Actinomycetota bacterium]|nr:polysaccharide deacetylase family protein [Actinomycetota bacterium]